MRPGADGSAVVKRIDTTDKVVFLTIDDGQVRDPETMQFMIDRKWPATLFLVSGEFRADPDYFARITTVGGNISSHTLTHPALKGMGLEAQRKQICGMKSIIAGQFGGFSGRLFRPPYGSWDDNTRLAAASCGINAVVIWNSELWEGNVDLAHRPALQPGDIFLTHFRHDLLDNLKALEAAITEQGFTIGRLEDYLPLD